MSDVTRRQVAAAGAASAILSSSGQKSLAAPAPATQRARRHKRPNIIVLLADDLGYGDLGCYGHPSINTPALDLMAAEGQRWTDFYAGSPVCSPSRGALMTGQLPVRSGLYGKKNVVFWPDAKGGIPAKHRTVAEALRGAGYATAMIGKWHLGDRADALPTRHGFDHWFGTPYSNDMNWTEEPEFQQLMVWRGRELSAEDRDKRGRLAGAGQARMFLPDRLSSTWNVPLLRSAKALTGYRDSVVERPAKQETLTRRYTEEAVSFLKKQTASERPFFLYLAYNMPHRPTFASQAFKGRSLRGEYGDAVEEIDWSVAQLRQALREASADEDTLIVFSSDNGPEADHRGGSSGLLRGTKGTIFEGGLRVPGIFCWPGHITPGVVRDVGCLVDIFGTAVSVAGASEGQMEDSLDLSAAFRGRPSPRDSYLYYSFRGELLGYRKGPWKVLWTADGFTPGETKLHNLLEDPSERFDLAAAHAERTAALTDEAKSIDAAIVKAPPIFDQQA